MDIQEEVDTFLFAVSNNWKLNCYNPIPMFT
jgi:hypothetical protein